MIIFLELGAWLWLIALCVAIYKFVESIHDLRVHRATVASRPRQRRRVRLPQLHVPGRRGAKA